jgi:endonuclease YncB( thermonuclease family)
MAVALCVSISATAAAGEVLPGPIAARVLRVLDGDTLEVAARIWLEQELTVRVRLDGVDAPEARGRCPRERALALRAKDLIAGAARDEVALTRIRYDKYGGRVVARVTGGDGRDLSESLLAEGLAHRYDGGHKRGWCDAAR